MIEWTKPCGLTITTNDLEATIEMAVSLGWKTDSMRNDGDKGSGVLGSLEWHETAIKGMDSKDEIIDYLKELDIAIDARGGIEKLKVKALDAIGKNYDNGSTDS